MSWVYLLCDHSEVVTTVTHFITKVVTQYSTTPKILRTDNALEFVQASLRTFCADHGTVHQITCFHTSQQNGVAERKHRQLLDITRTLLIEMHVPSYLWSDALMTATYLHNRLPSTPLGGAIPLHRLSPTSSLFSLPPRVFGCVAFVQDHSPSLSKLAPRALKGMFVGYSRTQKGYRVYFPDTQRYMTSADVTLGLSLLLSSLAFSNSYRCISSAWLPSLDGPCRSMFFSSPPPLHSFNPLLLLMFPRFSPSHLLQIPIPYPPPPRPPRHPQSSFPQPLQMIFTFPSPFARVHAAPHFSLYFL